MGTVRAARRRVLPPVHVDPATLTLLQQGKLEKACPDCGRWEAASFYCTGCLRPMGPADWYANGDLERRKAALALAPQKAQTPGKGRRGRPRRVSQPEPVL